MTLLTMLITQWYGIKIIFFFFADLHVYYKDYLSQIVLTSSNIKRFDPKRRNLDDREEQIQIKNNTKMITLRHQHALYQPCSVLIESPEGSDTLSDTDIVMTLVILPIL